MSFEAFEGSRWRTQETFDEDDSFGYFDLSGIEDLKDTRTLDQYVDDVDDEFKMILFGKSLSAVMLECTDLSGDITWIRPSSSSSMDLPEISPICSIVAERKLPIRCM